MVCAQHKSTTPPQARPAESAISIADPSDESGFAGPFFLYLRTLNPAYSPGCVNGRSLPFWEGSSAA